MCQPEQSFPPIFLSFIRYRPFLLACFEIRIGFCRVDILHSAGLSRIAQFYWNVDPRLSSVRPWETMDGAIRKRKQHSSGERSGLKERWNERHVIHSGRRPLLCSYEELPLWYKESENEYIRHGYRPELQSTWACLSSWTYVHNESFNIYSHLIAALSFLVGLFIVDRLMVWRYPAATIVDRAVFAFFVSAGVGAFTLSFLYHTFICHSLRFSTLWLQLDFVGIVTLTLGGFISGIYVGFYCDPALQKIYWSMVSIPAPSLLREPSFVSTFLRF